MVGAEGGVGGGIAEYDGTDVVVVEAEEEDDEEEWGGELWEEMENGAGEDGDEGKGGDDPCQFVPKKMIGPLSRRCVSCGLHKDVHVSVGESGEKGDALLKDLSISLNAEDAEDAENAEDAEGTAAAAAAAAAAAVAAASSEVHRVRDELGRDKTIHVFVFVRDDADAATGCGVGERLC